MDLLQELEDCIGFKWDAGNSGKNLEKHSVSDGESEEIFFNDPLLSGKDATHSKDDPRGFALGQTDAGRMLFVFFTIRESLIRVISSRDMTPTERRRFTK